jgi:ABC-type uncharacterized transport system involved in gliding motility auxiliary subunit
MRRDPSHSRHRPSRRQPASVRLDDAGYVLALLIHVLLLVAILGMVLFLAGRYRARVDLTADRVFTLSGSTEKVLARIEDRLRIEAWFSPDEELPATVREARRTLRNVLDEYSQRSRGRIAVQYLDPESDVELRKKAERLGIQAQRVQDLEGSTLSSKKLWQGLRFLYGGSKQKVVPVIGFTDQPSQYEAALTPLLKTVTITERPKIGVIQWPSPPPETSVRHQRAEGPKGFSFLLEIEDIEDRYEFVPVDLTKGQLVPEEIVTLVLFRPRGLSERNKYAIDQFLMRGGRLVIFADTDDVSLGQARVLNVREVEYDTAEPQTRFLEQLAHYGVVTSRKGLIDSASPRVPFLFAAEESGRFQQVDVYPYWFQPADQDWADSAAEIARARQQSDPALIASYKQIFRPGVDREHSVGLTVPTVFWPTAVDLKEPLPAGVRGHVLFRSSPLSALAMLPQSVHPIGERPEARQATYQSFLSRVLGLLGSEPPQQHGLMVALDGEFRSFWAGREAPTRPSAAKRPKDPLADPVGTEVRETDPLGPPLPDATTAGGPDKDADPPKLDSAADGARLIVIGDSDFLRDDLIRGDYQGIGGPVSTTGPVFFLSLLDWIVQDRDLFELRGKRFVDRRQRVIDDAEVARIAPERLQQEIARQESKLRWRNTLWPPLLFVLLGVGRGLFVWLRKRRFLAEVGG